MKKLWLASIAILVCCIQSEAQKYLNIYQDGLVIKKILASEVDSISITDRAPYTINMWYRGNIFQSFASEEVDSIKVINEKGGPLSYLGIVGFNSDLYTKDVALFSNSTVSQYRSFIDNLKKADGTILYYAVDNALNMLDGANIQTPLTSINFVTFTDGLDQGSIMMNNKFTSSNSYLQSISKRIKDSKYSGLKVDAYAIGLKGNDVSDVEMFRQNLKSLASSDQNAFELTNLSQLDTRLEEIAKRIVSVNTRQTISVKIPGVDDGTRVRFIFDGKDADNSQLYIEGTLNMTDYSLRDVTYQGIKARSGNKVQGTKVDKIFITFTFRGLRKDIGDDELSTRYMEHYYRLPSKTAWQKNSEFKPNSDIQRIVNHSGTLIILVLDCSGSLGDNDFWNMKSYAKKFINKVAENAMPFTFESPRNVKSGLDDNEFAVNVSWDAVSGADHYQIYRSSNGNSNSFELVADNVKSCSWRDTSPLSGNNYYKVCAVGLGLTTELSSGSSAVNFSLEVPKNVKAEMVENGEKLAVNVTWDAVKYAEAYQVYRSNSNSRYATYDLIADSVKSTSYKDESELSGNYYYRVRTIGHGAVSPDMNSSAAVNYSLGTPQNVKATQNSENLSINVTWDAVNFAQSYIIYRRNSYDGDYTEVAKDIKVTTWTDKTPQKGDNYYKVSAVGYGLTSSMSDRTNNINISLNTPYNVQAKLDDTEFKVTVTWDAVTCAEYYQVYRSSNNYSNSYELIADNVKSCSWTDASPKASSNGSYVYYKVNAVSGEITSSASYSTSVYCSLNYPNNVNAKVAINDNQLAVNVSWDAVKYAEAYQVYRSNSNSRYATYDLIADSVKSTSYKDDSELSGNYYYRVRAIGHGMTSSNSNTVSINVVMPAPMNVSSELVADGGKLAISVTWDAVDIAEKYQVYRSSSSSYYATYELIADDITTNSWIDKSPLSNNYYKVVAIGHGFTSEKSNSTNVTSLSMPTPTNVTAEMTLSGSNYVIKVAWDAIKIAEKYQVYRSSSSSSSYKLIADNVTTNSWTDYSPLSGYNYYKIVAIGYELTSNQSNASGRVNFSMAAPTGVTGELVLNNNKIAINVTWETVENAETYIIYRRDDKGDYPEVAKNVTGNSWTDIEPRVGDNYYKVQATGHGLTSQLSSNYAYVDCSLATPTSVQGELVENGTTLAINLTWDTVKFAESYNIYRSSNNSFDYNNPVAKNVTSNSWTDNEPKGGGNYYKVQATGHGLTSQLSSNYAYVDCSLATPTNVQGELVENGTTLAINLTWDTVKFAESYNIYRSSNNSFDYNNPVAKNVTSNSWMDNTPLDGYNYYRVEASGHGLNSGKSNYIVVNRSIPTPSNVNSELLLNNKKLAVSIKWDAVSLAGSYKVYRTNDNKLIAENITSTSCIDESPLEGSNSYQVYAEGYGLTSSESYTTSINYAIDSPRNLKGELILSDGKQVVSLSWETVTFAESYTIYRTNSWYGTYEEIAKDVTSTSWKDENPLDGDNYYKVSASGYGLNSGQSGYIYVTK